MFFVIKESYIFSCMLDKTHVPKEHKNFVFSENEILHFDGPTMVDIFNTNDLENRKLESSTNPDVVRVYLRELLTEFKLPERRYSMAKKEAPKAPVAGGAEDNENQAKGSAKRLATITLKVETNPKREGSKAHERFAFYQDGMTVGEFLEAGGTMADVNYDSAKGFIELTEAP